MYVRIELAGDTSEEGMKKVLLALSECPDTRSVDASCGAEPMPPMFSTPEPDTSVEKVIDTDELAAARRSEAAKKAAATRAANKKETKDESTVNTVEGTQGETVQTREVSVDTSNTSPTTVVSESAARDPEVTLEQLRVPAAWLMQNHKSQELNKLIRDFGGTTLSKVPVENWGALLAAILALKGE